MEISYVKSEKIMFSLSGEVCGKEEIKIFCIDSSAGLYSENGCLYKDKRYRITIFNLSKESIRVFVNGEERELLALWGVKEFSSLDLRFGKAGDNNIRIFLSDKEYISVNFEVCVEYENYKTDFHCMKAAISSYGKKEILAYAESECEKAGFEILKKSETVCDMLRQTIEKVTFLIQTQNNRKYYGGDLFSKKKTIKKNVKGFKSINIYNTKENRKLKSEALKLEDFLKKLIKLCEDEAEVLEKLKNNFSFFLKASVVAMADLNEPEKEIKTSLSGSFPDASADEIGIMYKFFCFAALNKILSKLYIPLENEIFAGEFYIYKKRETKFINTENDNVVTLTYNISEEPSAIFMKVNRKERITSHRRVYILKPVYKKGAGKTESDIAYKYKGMYKIGLVTDAFVLAPSKCGEYENIISLSSYDRQEAETFLKYVLGDGDLNEYPPYEDVVCDVIKEEFCLRDVLVAVVKTKSQFNTNIRKKFYYIPARFIENGEDIKYVALYQSKTLFDHEAGIRYYGRVSKIRLVPRYEISEISKNSDEAYFRFDVEEWNVLENVIKPKNFAEVCMLTNMFLLKNAKELPDLYINSVLEYILYCAKDVVNFRFEGAYFKCEKEVVTVYFKNGETVKFGRNAYKAVATKIEEMLKGENK